MDKKKRRTILGGLGLAVLTGIAVFFGCFRITSVKVEGNKSYTEDEIINMVLEGPLSSNSMLAMLINPEERTKDAEFINKIWMERKNRNSIVIHVREKEFIGYVKFLDGCFYFDKKGIVQVSTVEALDGVPYIEGVSPEHIRIGEKLHGITSKELNMLFSIVKMVESSDYRPERMVFDEKGQLYMYYDEIQVNMGSDENLDGKVSRLLGILPQLDGMKGILHLENANSTTESIVFEKTLSEEEQQAKEAEQNSETDSEEFSYNDESYDDGSYDDENYDDENYDDENYDDESYDDESYDDESYDDENYDDENYDDVYGE
ncbi:MAG: hypothetical protein ACI4EO_07180 [Blautia sp.]